MELTGSRDEDAATAQEPPTMGTEFLGSFTTTIGKRIYTPFDIGVPDERYDLWGQISVCVHEHQHVEQLLRDGWLKFAGRYLVPDSKGPLS